MYIYIYANTYTVYVRQLQDKATSGPSSGRFKRPMKGIKPGMNYFTSIHVDQGLGGVVLVL